MPRPPKHSRPLTKRHYEALSEFRYRLRQFMRFSEKVARNHGVTPLHYQLLLHVRGFPGRDWATVGEIAKRLQAHAHGTLALVARCEANGLLFRRRGARDRRQVEIRLTRKGERKLQLLARLHRAELESVRETMQIARITAPLPRRRAPTSSKKSDQRRADPRKRRRTG